jgi:coenzyme F420-reducing hydrogenase alpha subunit
MATMKKKKAAPQKATPKKKAAAKKPVTKKKASAKAAVKKDAGSVKNLSMTRTIKVDELSRVEGEGALFVRVKDGVVKEANFRIFEPPRFFEAFLRGRSYMDVPDITARICGICPMAYLMGAQQAMENALGIKITKPIRDLRRLMYCGEWIESHVLHAAMLHAPDFLGLQDVLQLAATNKDVVEKALKLKKLGNDILEVIGGGRAIHPINTRVGGFYKVPSKAAIKALEEPLKWGIDATIELAKLFGTFNFPDYEYDYHCVSLKHPNEYAIVEGRIVSDRGIDIPLDEFHDNFKEMHVHHSTALHGLTKKDGQPYLVGPIARYNNNYDQLTKAAKQLAKEIGLGPVCKNPFKSILVRMVENLYACEEALRLVRAYEEPDKAFVVGAPEAATGFGCTEAPRGICFHRYKLDAKGHVLDATITPPTAQNQPQIERDLVGVVEKNLDLNEEALKWRCEQTIRNYDPCISCSTHFLKLTMVRD